MIMRLLEEPAIKDLFNGDFENDVLKSAYSYIHNLHDPLRCNVFALVIREFIRIAMERISPDDIVSEAPWFDDKKITRADRYRFAITGTISDEQIEKYRELDSREAVQQLVDLNNTLNKYAHLSPGTYNPSQSKANELLSVVEDVVIEYVQK